MGKKRADSENKRAERLYALLSFVITFIFGFVIYDKIRPACYTPIADYILYLIIGLSLIVGFIAYIKIRYLIGKKKNMIFLWWIGIMIAGLVIYSVLFWILSSTIPSFSLECARAVFLN